MRLTSRLAIAALWVLVLPTAIQARERVYYFHNDHLGTPQAMTDQAGRVVWQAEYDPFGKATLNQDPDGDGQQVINNLRFPGQYFDAETGLHYNWHRDYDPDTGRYLQPDPMGIQEGIDHLYIYADGNSLNNTDRRGLRTFPSLNECAIAGMRFIYPLTMKHDIEYGGYIRRDCEGSQEWSYTFYGIHKGTNASVDIVHSDDFAWFHSHNPSAPDKDTFTKADAYISWEPPGEPRVGFVVTPGPGRRFLRYDPSAYLQGTVTDITVR